MQNWGLNYGYPDVVNLLTASTNQIDQQRLFTNIDKGFRQSVNSWK